MDMEVPARVVIYNVKPTEVLCDNTADNGWAHNSESSKRTEHIDLKNHFVKQIVKSSHALANYIEWDKNETDQLRNPLATKNRYLSQHDVLAVLRVGHTVYQGVLGTIAYKPVVECAGDMKYG